LVTIRGRIVSTEGVLLESIVSTEGVLLES
jgi:hypothetical protein